MDLAHPDPFGMGPFCRLRVSTTAPQSAGVYAWVLRVSRWDARTMTTRTAPIEGAEGIPDACSSQWTRLLNAALLSGSSVEWWWIVAAQPDQLEAMLIEMWDPPWNIALGRVR